MYKILLPSFLNVGACTSADTCTLIKRCLPPNEHCNVLLTFTGKSVFRSLKTVNYIIYQNAMCSKKTYFENWLHMVPTHSPIRSSCFKQCRETTKSLPPGQCRTKSWSWPGVTLIPKDKITIDVTSYEKSDFGQEMIF